MTQSVTLEKLINIVRALRITEWRAYVGIAVYGALLSSNDILETLEILPPLMIGVFLYMASAYLANNVFDVKGDSLSKRKSTKNPFTTGSLTLSEGIAVTLITSSLGILFVIMTTNSLAAVSYIIGLFLALMYSIPPVRLKERVILDLLSHSIFFGAALFLFGFFLNGDCPPAHILATIITYSMILELRNEIEDIHVDKEAGYYTTAVVLGYECSVKLLRSLLAMFVSITFFSLYRICTLALIPFITFLTIIIATRLDIDHETRLMDAYAVAYYVIILIAKFL